MNNIFWAKKLIGAALAAGMACTALGGFGTLTASAIVDLDGHTYAISRGEATLVRGNPDATDVTVPDGILTLEGDVVPVTRIAKGAFRRHATLTSVKISSSITSIGPEAFARCTSLDTVDFEKGSHLTDIGDNAFARCAALQSIDLPDSVQKIDETTFGACKALQSIVIPAGVRQLSNWIFASCSSLASVTFAEDAQLTEISNGAFAECASLQSIAIPASVTSIGESAFEGCSSLVSAFFSPGSQLKEIEYGAFSGCETLSSVALPASVRRIDSDAFGGCSALASATFEDGSQLEKIEDRAFADCTALQSVSLRCGTYKPPVFGLCAFKGCWNLQHIKMFGKLPVVDLTDAFRSEPANGLGLTEVFEANEDPDYDEASYSRRYILNTHSNTDASVCVQFIPTETEDTTLTQAQEMADELQFDQDSFEWYNSCLVSGTLDGGFTRFLGRSFEAPDSAKVTSLTLTALPH